MAPTKSTARTDRMMISTEPLIPFLGFEASVKFSWNTGVSDISGVSVCFSMILIEPCVEGYPRHGQWIAIA